MEWFAFTTKRRRHRAAATGGRSSGNHFPQASVPTTLPTILFTNPLHPRVVRQYESSVRFLISPAATRDAIREAAVGTQAVIVRAQLPEDIFDAAKSLRAAVRHGVGFDMIPIEAASRCGVPVANVPAVNATTVAEFAIMQMLALARRQVPVGRGMGRRDWSFARKAADEGFELCGRSVGIVGLGNIGRKLARLAEAFGMQVFTYTPRRDELPSAVTALSLEELCARSDFIVIACPLNKQTEGMIHRGLFARMKKSACLINVARGPIVDQEALLEALRTGRIAGAALDVHPVSPLPENDPLYDLPNVLLTPHMAGITDDAMERIGSGAVSQALQILRGERPPHLLNPEIWARRRA